MMHLFTFNQVKKFKVPPVKKNSFGDLKTDIYIFMLETQETQLFSEVKIFKLKLKVG